MGAWKRSAIGPRMTLVLATLSPSLPAPAFALSACDMAAGGSIHRVEVGVRTIQDAIDHAVDGDDIVVGPGIYRERINFHGKAITIRSEAGAEQTLLDGASKERGVKGGSTVTMTSGEGPGSILRGFAVSGGSGTIECARQDPDSCRTLGGGFYLEGVSPIIEACLILNNAADHGGAVHAREGTPVFRDCWFYLNRSTRGGATINCIESRPRFVTCGFHEDGIQWTEVASINIRSDCGVGGSCCIRDACIISTRTACEDAGGFWQGEDMPCVSTSCPSPCQEDVNGDRRVNMTDVLRVIDAWGLCD